MKLTGYTRYSDSVLQKRMKRYVRNKEKTGVGIFTVTSPLCDVDLRRCTQRGKLPKAGHCYQAYASMMKAGPCRKVELEYSETVTVKLLGGGK